MVDGSGTDILVVEGIWAQGYGMVARSVLRDPSLSPDAKAMYGYIASFQGGSERTSTSTMRDELGMDKKRFWVALDELRAYMASCGQPLVVRAEAA